MKTIPNYDGLHEVEESTSILPGFYNLDKGQVKELVPILLGGPQVRFPPVFFRIEKTNGLKFHVTRCFDSRESGK